MLRNQPRRRSAASPSSAGTPCASEGPEQTLTETESVLETSSVISSHMRRPMRHLSRFHIPLPGSQVVGCAHFLSKLKAHFLTLHFMTDRPTVVMYKYTLCYIYVYCTAPLSHALVNLDDMSYDNQ